MDLIAIAKPHLQEIIALALLCIGLYIFYRKNHQGISLLWLGFRHNNFLFGKLRKLSKNASVQNGWFHSETQICQDYKPHHQSIAKDPNYYDSCNDYLDLIGERGRKPLTHLLLIGIFAVLLLEAWGFSYTMSGFIDISASEDTRKIMAWILAIGFAVALALVTHNMGHEIHRNKLIDNIRSLWAADHSNQKIQVLTQQGGVGTAAIVNPTDKNEPDYQRRLNRLELGKPTKTYPWTIATIITVIVIAAILTFIRVKALEAAQTMDNMCVQGSSQSESMPDYGDLDSLYGDPTDTPPATSLKAAADAKTQGESEICKATTEGSWATFGVMAILFMLLQAFATWVSMTFGFAGAQSSEAYKHTHRFSTRNEFELYYDNKAHEIADFAQKTLTRLQTRMADKLPQTTQSASVQDLIYSASDRSFYAFLSHNEEIRATAAGQKQEIRLTKERKRREADYLANVSQVELDIQSNHLAKTKEQSMEAVKGETIMPQTTNLDSVPIKQTSSSLSDEEVKQRLLAQLAAKNTHKKIESPEEQEARLLAEIMAEQGV